MRNCSSIAGGGGSSTVPTAAGSATSPSAFAGLTGAAFVGTWAGPCYPSPAGDGSFNQLTFRMTEATWDLDYVAHGDAACSGSAVFMTVNLQGPCTIGAPSAVAPGTHEDTFSFAKKSVTAGQQGAVGFLKEKCGPDAKVGEPVDLAGGCANLGAYPLADCKDGKQRVGGPNVHGTSNLSPLTPWQHENVDPFRHTGQDLISIDNGVNLW